METTKEAASSSPGPRRVIKRYSNRKLYDTRDSRYVTLQQIGEMVRAGEEVQIIDNKTKEDKTEVTLALILSEGLKSEPRSVPLATLRDLIQERGEKLWSQLKETPIGRLIPAAVPGQPGAPGQPTGAHPPAEAPVPEPPPVVAEDKRVDEKDKKGDDKPGRLSELMHSSLASLVPSAKQFHELQEQVQKLTQRLEELERLLAEQKNSKS
jgi:polyhydroxyalkanoate synthesis repressor PhaR